MSLESLEDYTDELIDVLEKINAQFGRINSKYLIGDVNEFIQRLERAGDYPPSHSIHVVVFTNGSDLILKLDDYVKRERGVLSDTGFPFDEIDFVKLENLVSKYISHMGDIYDEFLKLNPEWLRVYMNIEDVVKLGLLVLRNFEKIYDDVTRDDVELRVSYRGIYSNLSDLNRFIINLRLIRFTSNEIENDEKIHSDLINAKIYQNLIVERLNVLDREIDSSKLDDRYEDVLKPLQEILKITNYMIGVND